MVKRDKIAFDPAFGDVQAGNQTAKLGDQLRGLHRAADARDRVLVVRLVLPALGLDRTGVVIEFLQPAGMLGGREAWCALTG